MGAGELVIGSVNDKLPELFSAVLSKHIIVSSIVMDACHAVRYVSAK